MGWLSSGPILREGHPQGVLAGCMAGPEARDGEGHTDTAHGFLLCSCFSSLQKASEQLDLNHLTTMQQNKTNHAGSQLGSPVNQSNCRFIESGGLGFSIPTGNSFAFYLVVCFWPLVFSLGFFLLTELVSYHHQQTLALKTEEIEQERVEQHISRGAASNIGGHQHAHAVLELCCAPQARDTPRSHPFPSLIQLWMFLLRWHGKLGGCETELRACRAAPRPPHHPYFLGITRQESTAVPQKKRHKLKAQTSHHILWVPSFVPAQSSITPLCIADGASSQRGEK